MNSFVFFLALLRGLMSCCRVPVHVCPQMFRVLSLSVACVCVIAFAGSLPMNAAGPTPGPVSRASSSPDYLQINSLTTIAECNGGGVLIEDTVNGAWIISCPFTGIIRINSNGTRTWIASNDQCGGAYALALNSKTGDLYASCSRPKGPTIMTFHPDGSTTQLVQNFPGCTSTSITYDPARGLLYAACGSSMGVISVQTNSPYTITKIAGYPSCSSATGVAFDPSSPTGTVYASCYPGGLIAVDTAPLDQPKVLVSTAQCAYPKGITFNTFSGEILGTCLGSSANDTVVVSVMPSGQVMVLAVAGSGCTIPNMAVRDVGTGYVYVQCAGSISVIREFGGPVIPITSPKQCMQSINHGLTLNQAQEVLYVTCAAGPSSTLQITGLGV